MKLSKIYSNNNDVFETINFNKGLNIVLAKNELHTKNEIPLHNLGKSLLAKVMDFCLLKEVDSKHFTQKLLNHEKYGNTFKSFILYLEIKIADNKFLTIKRGFFNNTKIYFKDSDKASNFSKLPDNQWGDEYPIKKAKFVLDGKLNLNEIKPFEYRKGITQFLRHNEDYKDVFRMSKFKYDVDWKPYIAKILGFPYEDIQKKFIYDKEIDLIKNQIEFYNKKILKDQKRGDIKAELDEENTNLDRLEKDLDNFKFYPVDEVIIEKDLVNINTRIAELNNDLYVLNHNINLIDKSLDIKVDFDINNINKIFEEVNIHLKSETIRSYEELQNFYKNVTKERKDRLKKQKKSMEKDITQKKEDLKKLHDKREKNSNTIRCIEEIKKYKDEQDILLNKKIYIKSLADKIEKFDEIEELDKKIRDLKSEIDSLVEKIKEYVYKDLPEKYKNINEDFNNAIKNIYTKDSAVLTVNLNKENNIEFDSKYKKDGKNTEQDKGDTYKKIMCIFFDLAVLKSYKDDDFYHFVFHDAVLEGMDEQTNKNFMDYILKYCETNNIQYIFTALEDHINDNNLEKNIVIKTLTNKSEYKGTLFKCNF